MAIRPINAKSWQRSRHIAGELPLRGNLIVAGLDSADQGRKSVLVVNPTIPVDDRLDFDRRGNIAPLVFRALDLHQESASNPRAIEAENQGNTRCPMCHSVSFCLLLAREDLLDRFCVQIRSEIIFQNVRCRSSLSGVYR